MNFKSTIALFGLATVSAVVLRTLVSFFTIDSKSGFLKVGFELFSYIMLGIIALVAVLVILLGFRCKQKPQSVKKINIATQVIALLLGISVIYEACFVDYTVKMSALQNTLQMLLGIFGGGALVYFAVTAFLEQKFGKKYKFYDVCLITLTLFFLMRLVGLFITYAGVSTITDNVIELTCVCATLIFFNFFAKYQNSLTKSKAAKKLLPCALFASFCLLVYCVPVIITDYLGSGEIIHYKSLFLPTNLLACAFSISYTVDQLFGKEDYAVFDDLKPELKQEDEERQPLEREEEFDYENFRFVKRGGIIPPDSFFKSNDDDE